MAERASVTQGIYLAKEVAPGDGTTPNRVLNSFSIEPGVQVEMQRFRPTGQKLESIIVPGKEWTEATLSGLASYTEMHYLLSGIFGDGSGANAQPHPVGDSRLWSYVLSARNPDTVVTYSFVQGDSNFAHGFAYGLITELNLNMSREGLEVEGTMIGHELDVTGVSIPGAPTTVAELPILPTEVSVYLSDQEHLLGSSKLTRAISLNMTIGDRHAPVWVLDADENSFVAHVELAPSFEYELTLQANDDAMDILQNMREGDTVYIRSEAVSAQLAEDSPSTPFRFTNTAATKIADVDKFEDADGVYAMKYTLAAVHDNEEGFGVETELVNQQADF